MKVGKIKTHTRRDDTNIKNIGIMGYGESNDYPEKIRDIFNASPTGKGCLATAVRFIFGDGFSDLTLAGHPLNTKQKANIILRKAAEDYAMFGGFCLHLNYNLLGEVIEIQHIPFEHARISVDLKGKPDGMIAIHPDWTRRNKVLNLKVSKDTITYANIFNPNMTVVLSQIDHAGGIENYKGQVLYYSSEGEGVYPLSAFDACVTDMSTEESVSTVLNRNAKNNFLPAGLIIKKGRQQSTSDENQDEPEGDISNEIAAWQGDEKAAKMIVIETEFDEEAPEFVPFQIQNFDRMFDSTTEYIQDNIGRLFMQPPILRGVDVGAGFGADLMKNAYDFYNSIVESDRKVIEEEFKRVLELMPSKFSDYTIKPLQYQGQTTTQI